MAGKTLVILLATAVLAVAQSTPAQPEALHLLNNVAMTYYAMKSYSAKSTDVITTSRPGMQQQMEWNMTTTADFSGRTRAEVTGATPMLMIFDGKILWMYMSQLNKYIKLPTTKPGWGVEGIESAMATTGFTYKNVATNVKGATVLRSEKIPFSGSNVDCWVVSVEYQPLSAHASSGRTAGVAASEVTAKTLWVDKIQYLVYQEDSTSKKTIAGATGPTETKVAVKYESITVDPDVASDAFTFTPPPGATEIDLASFMPNAPPSK
jgi:outer membrane lipoprotein-sorting protein